MRSKSGDVGFSINCERLAFHRKRGGTIETLSHFQWNKIAADDFTEGAKAYSRWQETPAESRRLHLKAPSVVQGIWQFPHRLGELPGFLAISCARNATCLPKYRV